MIINILSLGEIVGNAGVYTTRHFLKDIQKEYNIDFTIANAQGATGGFGLGKNHAIQLLKNNIDVITGAEKLFYKHDLVSNINSLYSVLKPFNLPNNTPGKSIYNKTIKDDVNITVINMMGSSGYDKMHAQNPFLSADYILNKIDKKNIIIVQFFSVTTAESCAFGYYLDGKVSSVLSTGGKVLTADAKILDKGTSYITDLGRVGSLHSVHGFEPENEIEKYLTGIPLRSKDTFENLTIQGVVVSIDTETKKTVNIETISKSFEAKK